MGLQTLVVALVVAGSFVYAAWSLMPQALRRRLAARLLRLPVPARWLAPLQRVAQATGGCDCSGCDRAPGQGGRVPSPTRPASEQPLVFHRPKKH
jgi:hypothetical protein